MLFYIEDEFCFINSQAFDCNSAFYCLLVKPSKPGRYTSPEPQVDPKSSPEPEAKLDSELNPELKPEPRSEDNSELKPEPSGPEPLNQSSNI